MKIKTKKTMNLPQLIEWGFKNDVTNTWYIASNVEEYISEVFFGATGLPQFSNMVDKNDLFKVEVEEEITEDTVIPRLITRNTHGGYNEWTNESVNGFNLTHVEAIYIPNDDLTLTLIWTKDKGLVE